MTIEVSLFGYITLFRHSFRLFLELYQLLLSITLLNLNTLDQMGNREKTLLIWQTSDALKHYIRRKFRSNLMKF